MRSISGPCAAWMRSASARTSAVEARSTASSAISIAPWWWTIISCANWVSASLCAAAALCDSGSAVGASPESELLAHAASVIARATAAAEAVSRRDIGFIGRSPSSGRASSTCRDHPASVTRRTAGRRMHQGLMKVAARRRCGPRQWAGEQPCSGRGRTPRGRRRRRGAAGARRRRLPRARRVRGPPGPRRRRGRRRCCARSTRTWSCSTSGLPGPGRRRGVPAAAHVLRLLRHHAHRARRGGRHAASACRSGPTTT